MDASKRPQPGDIYLVPDDGGHWAMTLYFVRLHRDNPAVGVFRDEAGELYVCGFEDLQPARLAAGETCPVPAEETGARWYRNRTRVTARQRAAGKMTAKQRAAIFALGAQRGLDIDDLRGMAPHGSISRLTIGEAAALIDRLKGRKVGT